MTDADRETPGLWRISDSDDCQVINEHGVVVARCERAADARMISMARLMATLCRSGASGENLDARHFFGNMEYVVSVIGEEIKEDDEDEDEDYPPPTPAPGASASS